MADSPVSPRPLPPAIFAAAVCLLTLALSGLAVLGLAALAIALPRNTLVSVPRGLSTVVIVGLGIFFSFTLWTAVGLLDLAPWAWRGLLTVLQSLVSVGFASGLTCFYLAREQDETSLHYAGIALLLLGVISGVAKLYFRRPAVARYFVPAESVNSS